MRRQTGFDTATPRAIFPCVCAVLLAFGATARAEPISFNRDIRPILSENCFHCHGPDGDKREADLRLDQFEAAVDYGAIVPGSAADSEVIARVFSDDPDVMMPPPDSKRSLSPEQKERLRTWIDEGAEYESHWAFIPPQSVTPPAVAEKANVRNEIDRFVRARLEREGVTPAPEANRETLIRRLSFDLTGLPPTIAEIDAFLADDSPNAYEKVVDRLLASERYGERMASEWLDVARYSDSYGYQVDRDRFVWPWRDWVIRAFNANMPYDRFITEQLAGDLLPNADDNQILATTFNRLHPQKVEGGSVPEEFRVEYVADRTQTVATAFLGLTMECCRCHDHKYDPITQAEYYQLSSFFDNIDEAGLYSFFTPAIPTPTLLLADDAQKKLLAELDQQISAAEASLEQTIAQRGEAFGRWRAESVTALPDDPEKLIPGRVAHLDFESAPSGGNVAVDGVVGQAVKLSGDDAVGTDVGNFRRFQPFSVALWMNTPDVKDRAVIFHRSRAWTDAASRGYELLIEDGRLSAALIHFWPGNALRVRSVDPVPIGKWQHVTVTYDGSSRADGLKLYLDGEPLPTEVVRDNLTKNITGGGGDNIAIGERFRDRGFTNGLVDEFMVYERELTAVEAAQLHDGRTLIELLEAPGEDASETGQSLLYGYYVSVVDEDVAARRAELRALRQRRCETIDPISEIMVMRELDGRRPTHLLKRGAYDAPAQEVRPGTPAVLASFPADAPANRLGLARWLTDPSHPLTGRVAVNRYWQMLFGDGLVRTPEDFGSQGQMPTHPDLLDWLAVDFVSHGWDVRRLLKTIVMSATYRQSSVRRPELMRRDPENRLLAVGPRFRLPAEMLRDNALAVSGLLTEQIGGPPAKPYEVEVSFKPTQRQKGPGAYRRSVYTYWKRTAPAPVMMAFDASVRDVCRVKRERTSSPLQALVLLNDPQIVEASRELAQDLIHKHQEDAAAQLQELFRRLTARMPTAEELAIVTELRQRQLEQFGQHPEQAAAYLAVGDAEVAPGVETVELAALATVVNALLNMDECVTLR